MAPFTGNYGNDGAGWGADKSNSALLQRLRDIVSAGAEEDHKRYLPLLDRAENIGR